MAIATRLRSYFARRLGAGRDGIEDLVQETLLAVHAKRATHDPSLPVSNWVHAIAGYKLADYWRRHGRSARLHDPLDDLDERSHPVTQAQEPARRDVDVLLATLPAPQRTAIAMLKLEGLSVAEASARSGVSPSALKVQVHRGLRRLAELVRAQA